MKRIFLVGYMGVGKTTLGKRLAKALDLTFVDLDAYIEQRMHQRVSELFAQYGEAGFREIEQRLLQEVSDFDNIVLATGGGAPCFYDNMEVMNRSGVTIFLDASPQTLWKRLKTSHNKRPLIQNKSDEELLNFINDSLSQRVPYYTQAQLHFVADRLDCIADIEKSTQCVVDMINIYKGEF